MASYRYERGVDTELCYRGARILAKMITEICGGKVNPKAYCYRDTEYQPQVLTLTTEINESGVYDILVVIVDGNLSGVGSVQGTVAVNRPALMPKTYVAGVAWDYGDPDPELYRLYTSAEAAAAAESAVGRAWDDPHDLVTVDIMEEPVSYIRSVSSSEEMARSFLRESTCALKCISFRNVRSLKEIRCLDVMETKVLSLRSFQSKICRSRPMEHQSISF